MSEKIKPEELRIDKLESKYRELLNNFTTSTKELKDFLIQDALNNQNQRLSVTFLWFYGNSLVGYVTLLTDKINLEGNLKEFFRENDIHYKSLPALKIGRLCVDENFLRRGIGKLMVMFSIQKSNEINEGKAGCRFITLDAKRNENRKLDSIHFYKNLGFKVLKERVKGTTPMYLDLKLP